MAAELLANLPEVFQVQMGVYHHLVLILLFYVLKKNLIIS